MARCYKDIGNLSSLLYNAAVMLGKTRWRRRLRRHGFLARSKSKTGRKVLKRRRAQGRKRIAVQKKLK